MGEEWWVCEGHRWMGSGGCVKDIGGWGVVAVYRTSVGV